MLRGPSSGQLWNMRRSPSAAQVQSRGLRDELEEFFVEVEQPALDKALLEHTDRLKNEMQQFLQDWVLSLDDDRHSCRVLRAKDTGSWESLGQSTSRSTSSLKDATVSSPLPQQYKGLMKKLERMASSRNDALRTKFGKRRTDSPSMSKVKSDRRSPSPCTGSVMSLQAERYERRRRSSGGCRSPHSPTESSDSPRLLQKASSSASSKERHTFRQSGVPDEYEVRATLIDEDVQVAFASRWPRELLGEQERIASASTCPAPPLLAPPPMRPHVLLNVAFTEDAGSREEVEPLVPDAKMDFATPKRSVFQGSRWPRAEALLERPIFEHMIGGLVIANAAVLGIETNYKASNRGSTTPHLMKLSEVIFCGIFTVELTLRISVYGARFFTSKTWMWNLFDLFVVSMQLLEQFLLQLLPRLMLHMNVQSLRMLRLLRLIRVTRLIRVLRLIEELRTIAGSIASSMKSLSFALVLLAMVVYAFSVVFLDFVNERLGNGHELGQDEQTLQDYFGSLGRTILTLFEAILGGLSWDAAVTPLIVYVSPACGTLFCFYIAFCVFALMNVVTGVFVEKATRMAQDDRDLYMASHIRDLFFDDKTTETITWEMFKSKLDDPDMKEYFKAINVDPSEAQGIFWLLDVDANAGLDCEELVHGLLRLRGSAKSLDLALLTYETERMSKRFREHAMVMEENLSAIQNYMHGGSSPRSLVKKQTTREKPLEEEGETDVQELGQRSSHGLASPGVQSSVER